MIAVYNLYYKLVFELFDVLNSAVVIAVTYISSMHMFNCSFNFVWVQPLCAFIATLVALHSGSLVRVLNYRSFKACENFMGSP